MKDSETLWISRNEAADRDAILPLLEIDYYLHRIKTHGKNTRTVFILGYG